MASKNKHTVPAKRAAVNVDRTHDLVDLRTKTTECSLLGLPRQISREKTHLKHEGNILVQIGKQLAGGQCVPSESERLSSSAKRWIVDLLGVSSLCEIFPKQSTLWVSKGLWQWLIHCRNIMLSITQYLSYFLYTRRFGKLALLPSSGDCRKTEILLTTFSFILSDSGWGRTRGVLNARLVR
jgi:hypothetical protein